jgi:hypothetical protein
MLSRKDLIIMKELVDDEMERITERFHTSDDIVDYENLRFKIVEMLDKED